MRGRGDLKFELHRTEKVRQHAHVHIRGHGYAAAIVGYDVATLVLAFGTFMYLVFLGKAFFKNVSVGGEGSIFLKSSIVSDLME